MTYGVVEFNHVAAQKTGQIKAQLPASTALATEVGNVLENGMFLVYDEVDGAVRLPAVGDEAKNIMLHKSAEKLYDKYANELGDFYLDLTSGVYPRMYAMNTADTFTLNEACLQEAVSTLTDGDLLYVDIDNAGAKLTSADGTNNVAVVKVVKATTAPNGVDPAVKVEVL